MGAIRDKLRYLCGLPFGKKKAIGFGVFDGLTTARPQNDHGLPENEHPHYYMGYGAGTILQLAGAGVAAGYGAAYAYIAGFL